MLLINTAIPTRPIDSTTMAARVSIIVKPLCAFLRRTVLWCDIDISIARHRHRLNCASVGQCKCRCSRGGLHKTAGLELQYDLVVQNHVRWRKRYRGAYVREGRVACITRIRGAAYLIGVRSLVERDVVRATVKHRAIPRGLDRTRNTGNCGSHAEILNAGTYRWNRHRC